MSPPTSPPAHPADTPRPAPPPVQALVFDVFGTVVDWRSGVIAEGRALAARMGWAAGRVDWADFAEAWRAGYQPALQQVRSGQRGWVGVDRLHAEILQRLLAERALTLPEPEQQAFNQVWHRLPPWPDSVEGLQRLRTRHPVAALSNGDLALLVAMARHGGLPWDAVLSAELFERYKPDPAVYLGAARLLQVAPGALLMVAAHPSDLRAARACGLRTAHVARPAEHGPGGPVEPWERGEFDLEVGSLTELAERLLGPQAR